MGNGWDGKAVGVCEKSIHLGIQVAWNVHTSFYSLSQGWLQGSLASPKSPPEYYCLRTSDPFKEASLIIPIVLASLAQSLNM